MSAGDGAAGRARSVRVLVALAVASALALSLCCAWGNLYLTRGCPPGAPLPRWWLYAVAPAVTLLCFLLPVSLWWRQASLDRVVLSLALGVLIVTAAWVAWVPIVNAIC